MNRPELSTAPPRSTSIGRWIRLAVTILVIGALASLPFLHRSVGLVFPGPLDSVGTLTMLSMMLVIAALAMTLYLLIGVTGMLSFGHALYFALGAYGSVIITNTTGIPFFAAAAIAVVGSTLVAFLVNGLALRAGVIGFSMITLAFAELMALSVDRGYLGSGGDTGVTLNTTAMPEFFRGLANIPRLYWMSLLLVIIIYVVVRIGESHTRFGRVWVSIRENELRTESLGFNVYGYKLAAAVVASFLASVCGVAYALVTGGAQPDIAQVLYSLGLVLMVILGGRGVLWGALLGGLLYTYLTLRLPGLVGTLGLDGLPDFVAIPLSEPEFILGLCFVVIILFLPGGLASGLQWIWLKITRGRPRRRGDTEPDVSGSEARQTETELVTG